MKKRMALWMFGLFRPRTRKHYREEFGDLVDELIGSGNAGWSLWLEVASAGIRDRASGVKGPGRIAVAGTIIVVAAFVLATRATVELRSPPTTSNAVAIVRPVQMPIGSQASVASCPKAPELSSPLPVGATISIASLVPSSLSTVAAAGAVHDLSGTCEYTLTLSQG